MSLQVLHSSMLRARGQALQHAQGGSVAAESYRDLLVQTREEIGL